MPNVLDYIREYGSCAFHEMPFSSVDALVLAQLSYIKYSDLFYKEQKRYEKGEITLAVAAKLLSPGNLSCSIMGTREDEKLLFLAAASRRFGKIKLWNYVNHIEEKRELQFSAITFVLDSECAYIAFRGTDNHLPGWLENTKMAFGKTMPSEQLAHQYLQAIGEIFEGELYVGGHSKGGALAMYACTHVTDKIHNKIKQIYCFDTPQSNEREMAVQDRITWIVPKDTLVGLLFGTNDKYIVVDSNKKGIWQHDPYSWQIREGSFIYLLKIRKRAKRNGSAINAWVETLSENEKNKVAKGFGVLMEAVLEKENINHLLKRVLDVIRQESTLNIFRILRLYFGQCKRVNEELIMQKREKKRLARQKMRYILDNIGKNS